MLIVLIRHAAAEKIAEGKEDRDRALTPAGRKAFQVVAEMLPVLFPHQAYIMASPLTRAQQTAQILAHSFDDVPIRQCDELAQPEIESFLETCKTKAGIIFAVGHEPFLGDWLFRLTGQEQPLKKGSAAAVDVDRTGQGRLVLYTKPQSCLGLQRGEFPYEQLTRLLMLRSQMIGGHCDKEAVHQLRIAMRRLKIMLYGIKPLLPREELVSVLSDINDLFGYTDNVRDYDVLLDFIQSTDGSFPELLQYIHHLKEEKRAALLAVIESEKTTLALLHIFHLLASVPIEHCRETIKSQFASLIRKTRKQIEEMDVANALALHRLRICCKKVYYSAGIYPFAAKNGGKKMVEQSKLLKDILGFQHDVFIGRSLLENAMGAQSPVLQEQSRKIAARLLDKQMKKEDLEKQIRIFEETLLG